MASIGRPRFRFRSANRVGSGRGLLHFSGIKASRIRFGPANRVRPKRGATTTLSLLKPIVKVEVLLTGGPNFA